MIHQSHLPPDGGTCGAPSSAHAVKSPFHWRTAISWKTVDGIWCRGYDVNELADKVSFADMMFVLYQGRLPTLAQSRMLEHIMVVFVEHAFSPSTVAARVTAAGRPALNAAIAAGVLTFGDAHGPGLAYSRLMTRWVAHARAKGRPLRSVAERVVRRRLAKGKKILGINQPQHVNGDPRVRSIFEKADALGISGDFVALQRCIQDVVAELKGRHLRPNLLAAAGSVLLDLGFEPPACWSIGILCRAFGCSAHAIEEMSAESPWRASKKNDMADLLDLSLQGPAHYSGPPERRVPTREERGGKAP